MSLIREQITALLRADFQAATLFIVDGTRSFQQFYRNLVFKPHAKNAMDAFSQTDKNTLEEARTHILNCKFDEAHKILSQLCQNIDLTVQTEALYELTRVYAFQGKWQECLNLCNQCLNSHPALITKISCLQVRSIAFYELSDFTRALQDIEEVERQESLFPHAVALHLAKSHKVKVLARLERQVEAEDLLHSLWITELNVPTLNLYYLLILGRVEIELARLQRRKYYSWILFCLNIADEIGDKLYYGLALMDLATCYQTEIPSQLKEDLLRYQNEFYRVKLLWDEMQSSQPKSTMAKILKKSNSDLIFRISASEKVNYFETHPILVLMQHKVVLDLRKSQVFADERASVSAKIFTALTHLQLGVSSKKDFFEAVWQHRYVADLHDTVIRSFIYRLKKDHQILISSKKTNLYLESKILIL